MVDKQRAYESESIVRRRIVESKPDAAIYVERLKLEDWVRGRLCANVLGLPGYLSPDERKS